MLATRNRFRIIFAAESEKNNALNLKSTELGLGLPGFGKDLEENDSKNGSTKIFVSGAKRGGSDTNIDGSGKWVFPVRSNAGSDADLAKRCEINGCSESNQTQQSIPATAPKPVEEKKKAPVTNENGSVPPAAKLFLKNTMASNLSE